MTPQETAIAYSRAYHIFGQILLSGMTDELHPLVSDMPELESIQPQSIDDWKADHYALFGMNVFPYETVYLTADGLLGGYITESVTKLYDEAGYQPDDSVTADHIANQLGLMAFLCSAEAEAREDEVTQAIYHMLHLQRQFLDQHLLHWLPSFVMSIHQQRYEAFSIIADLILDLAFDHRQSLDDDLMHSRQPLSLPPIPNILDDEKTGLKDIAEYLLTPIYTGIYLSRDDISRIGNQFRLPRGFGKRDQMLTQLFHTAVDHSAMNDLVRALQQEVDTWREFYLHRVPDDHYSTAWLSRLNGTTEFLDTIRSAL